MSQELNLIKKEDMSESAILNTENTTNPSDIKSISILNIETDKEELNKIKKIFGNDVKEQNPFRLGNTYALYYFDGEPLIVIGPHWPFCIFLMGTIMTIGYFFFLYLWSFLDDLLIFLGMCVFGFFIISYTITLLKNPGIPKRKYSILNLNPTILKNKKICLKCQIYSEHSKIVRHCFECNVCIKGMEIFLN